MHVFGRTFLDALKVHIATGGAQLFKIRLCIGLILTFQVFGEGDVLNETFLNGFFEGSLFLR